MDPDRKRRIRLVVALSAARAARRGPGLHLVQRLERDQAALRPGGGRRRQLRADRQGRRRLGRATRAAELDFEVADRDDPAAKIPVTYSGHGPRPVSRGPRGDRLGHGHATAPSSPSKDSLITKCPSKFADEAAEGPRARRHRVDALVVQLGVDLVDQRRELGLRRVAPRAGRSVSAALGLLGRSPCGASARALAVLVGDRADLIDELGMEVGDVRGWVDRLELRRPRR